jgi:hypothetical protein
LKQAGYHHHLTINFKLKVKNMALYTSFESMNNYIPVTIAVGQTKSAAMNIVGNDIIGFWFPSGLTGTSISFENADQAQSITTSTFAPLYDDAQNLVSVLVPASLPGAVYLSPSILPSLTVFKVVSGTIQATADATIYLIVRPV